MNFDIHFVFLNFAYPPKTGMQSSQVSLLNWAKTRNLEVKVTGVVKAGFECDEELFHSHYPNCRIIKILYIRYGLGLFSVKLLADVMRLKVLGAPSELMANLDLLTDENVDRRVFYGLSMAPAGFLGEKPVFLDSIDFWSMRQKRFAESADNMGEKIFFTLKKYFSIFLEKLCVQNDVHMIFYSKAESEAFQSIYPNADCSYIGLSRDIPQNTYKEHCDSNVLKCLIYANTAAEHLERSVDILLSQLEGEAILRTVKLELLSKKKYAPKGNILLEQHSWVDDIDFFLSSFDVIILPDLNGSGLKNRVLDCLAVGSPLLATPVASEGLDIPEQCLYSGKQELLAKLSLLIHCDVRNKFMLRQQRCFFDHYTLEKKNSVLDKIFKINQ